MEIFTLPFDTILDNKKKYNTEFSVHFSYSNGYFNINFSQSFNCLRLFTEKVNDKYNEKYEKVWEIHSISKSTLKKLNEHVNKFLLKINISDKFYDVYNYTEYKKLYNELRNINTVDFESIKVSTKNGKEIEITFKNLVNEKEININDVIYHLDNFTDSSIICLINYMNKLKG